jgi:Thiolase, C-terminal domain
LGLVESYASVGVEPEIMGIGHVPAVRKAVVRAGLELGMSTCSSLTRRSRRDRSSCSGSWTSTPS